MVKYRSVAFSHGYPENMWHRHNQGEDVEEPLHEVAHLGHVGHSLGCELRQLQTFKRQLRERRQNIQIAAYKFINYSARRKNV